MTEAGGGGRGADGGQRRLFEPGRQAAAVVLVVVDQLRDAGARVLLREVELAARRLLDVVVLHLRPRPDGEAGM